MAQATGRVTIKLNSESIRSKPGASLQIGGIQREYETTDQLEVYYREKGSVARIKATMPHMSDTDLAALRDFKDGTVTFRTDTGRVYTISGAGTENLGELSNGEVEINLAGEPV